MESVTLFTSPALCHTARAPKHIAHALDLVFLFYADGSVHVHSGSAPESPVLDFTTVGADVLAVAALPHVNGVLTLERSDRGECLRIYVLKPSRATPQMRLGAGAAGYVYTMVALSVLHVPSGARSLSYCHASQLLAVGGASGVCLFRLMVPDTRGITGANAVHVEKVASIWVPLWGAVTHVLVQQQVVAYSDGRRIKVIHIGSPTPPHPSGSSSSSSNKSSSCKSCGGDNGTPNTPNTSTRGTRTPRGSKSQLSHSSRERDVMRVSPTAVARASEAVHIAFEGCVPCERRSSRIVGLLLGRDTCPTQPSSSRHGPPPTFANYLHPVFFCARAHPTTRLLWEHALPSEEPVVALCAHGPQIVIGTLRHAFVFDTALSRLVAVVPYVGPSRSLAVRGGLLLLSASPAGLEVWAFPRARTARRVPPAMARYHRPFLLCQQPLLGSAALALAPRGDTLIVVSHIQASNPLFLASRTTDGGDLHHHPHTAGSTSSSSNYLSSSVSSTSGGSGEFGVGVIVSDIGGSGLVRAASFAPLLSGTVSSDAHNVYLFSLAPDTALAASLVAAVSPSSSSSSSSNSSSSSSSSSMTSSGTTVVHGSSDHAPVPHTAGASLHAGALYRTSLLCLALGCDDLGKEALGRAGDAWMARARPDIAVHAYALSARGIGWVVHRLVGARAEAALVRDYLPHVLFSSHPPSIPINRNSTTKDTGNTTNPNHAACMSPAEASDVLAVVARVDRARLPFAVLHNACSACPAEHALSLLLHHAHDGVDAGVLEAAALALVYLRIHHSTSTSHAGPSHEATPAVVVPFKSAGVHSPMERAREMLAYARDGDVLVNVLRDARHVLCVWGVLPLLAAIVPQSVFAAFSEEPRDDSLTLEVALHQAIATHPHPQEPQVAAVLYGLLLHRLVTRLTTTTDFHDHDDVHNVENENANEHHEDEDEAEEKQKEQAWERARAMLLDVVLHIHSHQPSPVAPETDEMLAPMESLDGAFDDLEATLVTALRDARALPASIESPRDALLWHLLPPAASWTEPQRTALLAIADATQSTTAAAVALQAEILRTGRSVDAAVARILEACAADPSPDVNGGEAVAVLEAFVEQHAKEIRAEWPGVLRWCPVRTLAAVASVQPGVLLQSGAREDRWAAMEAFIRHRKARQLLKKVHQESA